MSENSPSQDSHESKYFISDDLKAAVEVAIDLGMPLLITGEPGTGKTRLADHVAAEMLSPSTEVLPFYTKTTSKAKDLLYRYDALSHFRDSQMKQDAETNPMDYVVFQPLGDAILRASEKRVVVLVDEIDKAPRDFPNDVLFEFDEMAFKVDEASKKNLEKWAKTQKDYKKVQLNDKGFFYTEKEAKKRPVLILTSNSEKNLPDAFLRRCVYFHIEFPKPEALLKIVKKQVPISDTFTEQMMKAAVIHFDQIRKEKVKKLPATAELLAWVKVLKDKGLDVTKALDENAGNLFTQLQRLNVILFKNKEDLAWANKTLRRLIEDTEKALKEPQKEEV